MFWNQAGTSPWGHLCSCKGILEACSCFPIFAQRSLQECPPATTTPRPAHQGNAICEGSRPISSGVPGPLENAAVESPVQTEQGPAWVHVAAPCHCPPRAAGSRDSLWLTSLEQHHLPAPTTSLEHQLPFWWRWDWARASAQRGASPYCPQGCSSLPLLTHSAFRKKQRQMWRHSCASLAAENSTEPVLGVKDLPTFLRLARPARHCGRHTGHPGGHSQTPCPVLPPAVRSPSGGNGAVGAGRGDRSSLPNRTRLQHEALRLQVGSDAPQQCWNSWLSIY